MVRWQYGLEFILMWLHAWRETLQPGLWCRSLAPCTSGGDDPWFGRRTKERTSRLRNAVPNQSRRGPTNPRSPPLPGQDIAWRCNSDRHGGDLTGAPALLTEGGW